VCVCVCSSIHDSFWGLF